MSNSFAWEKEYKRTWENSTSINKKEKLLYQKHEFNDKKKGVIRHVHIIIDCSYSIDKTDYLPSFRTNYSKSLEKFIPKFYEENPISALSFSLVNEVVLKYTTEPNFSIKDFLSTKGEGNFSLLNALNSSFEILKNKDFCKEIIVITSSLMIRDPDSYSEIIDLIKKIGVKIFIISMCGELMIYKEITKLSGGRLYVPLDLDHFDYILDCLTLPNENNFSTTNMIQLGFPSVIEEVRVCSCHNEMNQEGYECPVCKTYICNLPVGCPICETQLVSAINISKSFHHLFPLSEFILDSNGKCFTCGNRSYSKCPKCDLFYCEECDNFVHENLQFCYGC
ncbi:TFIIH basal transcription factor complex p47 subunit [Nosema bombycis CQ1]|uniref:TFIIH basal transcription factor complex p47 subunit n=1 Tax=Nosema bombycis (strain CQ1 / CVCC 102059) TaxID=578461 RepID=R0M1R4_NOSB1|nr:TFIIH basal transcription factor complex p47 subunit [Nosema bombycis CQ1]|eukprot:EOB11954.1 TFIIH basal transcription factor complex p47 subunit [Nosema bombycis CQ1]